MMQEMMTRSPTASLLTAWPTSVIVPTPSCPRIRPSVTAGTSPLRMCRSVPQIVVVSSCTITSVGSTSSGREPPPRLSDPVRGTPAPSSDALLVVACRRQPASHRGCPCTTPILAPGPIGLPGRSFPPNRHLMRNSRRPEPVVVCRSARSRRRWHRSRPPGPGREVVDVEGLSSGRSSSTCGAGAPAPDLRRSMEPRIEPATASLPCV